jgi:serine/threonine protein kinase
MASHDFASTYVGTPFYMSPEICAAEQYSLFSDIWAFGCIMYELCSREPPFNAKTHLELIQKIRLGKIRPLSSIYSRELQETIASCLRVNPHSRPDTSQLLNLPMVKLKRKEMEVVALGKLLKIRDEQVARKEMELDHQLDSQNTYRDSLRAEVDASLRREWEVKARLEIDRQVQVEVQRLRKDWDGEIDRRVMVEVQRMQQEALPPRSSTPNPDDVPDDIPFLGEYRQSQAMFGEAEFDDSPDMSELSMESPTVQRVKNTKAKRPSSRTPFTRAHTMFENQDSPADISMAEPSPAPIASLNLSPRRTSSKTSGLARNLFTNIAKSNRSTPSSAEGGEPDDLEDGEDTDGFATMPLPVGKKNVFSHQDPFKAPAPRGTRPGLHRATTSVPQNVGMKPTLFGKKAATKSRDNLRSTKSRDNLRSMMSPGRLSKIPSASALGDVGSPQRRAPQPPQSPTRLASRPSSRTKTEDVRQAAIRNNASVIQGRSLVELAQARTMTDTDYVLPEDTDDFLRYAKAKSDGSGHPTPGAARNENEKPKSASAFAAAPVWDPERDIDMPSPFLQRGSKNMTGRVGGPGMAHLR